MLGLTYAAGLDNDVVETFGRDNFGELFDKVHFEGATYATVLQGHEVAGIFFADNTTFLNERCVDVYFADVVYNYSEPYSPLVCEDTVEQSSFAAAQISGEQQHFCFIVFHAANLAIISIKGL